MDAVGMTCRVQIPRNCGGPSSPRVLPKNGSCFHLIIYFPFFPPQASGYFDSRGLDDTQFTGPLAALAQVQRNFDDLIGHMTRNENFPLKDITPMLGNLDVSKNMRTM